MNCLHGIKISNDIRAVKGQSLTWRKSSRQLVLNGEPLTCTFLNRKSATDWATKNGAKVSPV
jgi:hypothetical protein